MGWSTLEKVRLEWRSGQLAGWGRLWVQSYKTSFAKPKIASDRQMSSIIVIGQCHCHWHIFWYRKVRLYSTPPRDPVQSICSTIWFYTCLWREIFCLLGKNTVYSIPEICFWKIRNTILIYHTWYKRDFRNNTEISAMNSIPNPHQPPLLSSFGISMFAYQKEIYTFQI